MHAYNWSEHCKPKEGGGIGIENLQDINAAAGLNLIWKLCTTKTLWTLWMNERYCKNTTLWETPVSPLDSGTRKFLTSCREVAASNMSLDPGTGIWTRNTMSNRFFHIHVSLKPC